MNVVEIEEAVSELAAKPFDPATFFLDLIASYGAPKVTITRIRNGDLNKTDLEDAWLWRLHIHAQLCPSGSLNDSLHRLRSSRQTQRQKARFILATDGQEVVSEDLKTGEPLHCTIGGLADHFGFFLPIAGYERYQAAEENPVDIRATGRLAKLYDELMRANPDWAEDAGRHTTNQFMTRVIFCLFAEDTGIFPDNLFSKTLKDLGGRRGENAQHVLRTVFAALATPEADRKGTPAWACAFPYVNGGLFGGDHEAPAFTSAAFNYLISAGAENWKEINPDIFGSMIQAVVATESRGELGLHYTSVPNILKVLDPLILDDLRGQLRKAWDSKALLQKFLARLGRLRIFDPACGSGNFLVIAYRELRTLEIEALRRLGELTGLQTEMFSRISLSHFHGIEYDDFAAETAKLSLWVAEYQMNKRFEAIFRRKPPALPLRDGGHITCDNALRMDWSRACPIEPDAEVETYVVGNPPYKGSTYQTDEQKSDMRALFSARVRNWKSLDYVAGWFLKASDYAHANGCAFAFVATNSICQGQQVAILWPHVVGSGELEIGFCHTSFKWSNNAAHNAGVICAIVGVRQHSGAPKYIYGAERRREARSITPYLIEGDFTYVDQSFRPLAGLPPMLWGNKATDGGHLILSPEEKDELLEHHPEAEPFIRRYVGSQEFIRGIYRYCLWIPDERVDEAREIPEIRARIDAVASMRAASKAAETRPAANYPHRFRQIQGVAREHSIVVPRVSGENRPCLPVGILTNGEIVNDNAFAIYDAPIWTIAVIASRLHLAWIAAVCGKLKNDFRYSNTLGWHTFPAPALSTQDRADLEASAMAILETREKHFPATIAELYDQETMPDDLKQAHRHNDETVERIFAGRVMKSDTERLEHLFRRYARIVDGAASASSQEAVHA